MRFFILVFALVISACSSLQISTSKNSTEPLKQADQEVGQSCSPEWFRYVNSQVPSSDSMGHGPDIASQEWKSVIEFKLGIQSHASLPPKNTPQWCKFIQSQLDAQRALTSFSCEDESLNAIEKEICQDQELKSLDTKLSRVFDEVLKKVSLEESRLLKTEQRTWVKRRNKCESHESIQACITHVYQYRIAELQARYQLVAPLGPVFYVCDGRPLDEIVVNFFATRPPSILAERAGQVSFMLLQETASGSRYQGQNETFWEHQGHATVTWGADTTEMNCEKMH